MWCSFWHGLGSCAELPPWKQEILQSWNAWTSLFLHLGHALLPTLRPGCWDLVADGVFKESPFLAWSGRWDAGTFPALLAWHCSQYGKLSGLIYGCLVEGSMAEHSLALLAACWAPCGPARLRCSWRNTWLNTKGKSVH